MGDTKFTKDNQPKGRGKSFKNKLIDTIREKAFLEHLATRAFDATDNNSSTLLKALIDKAYPSLKAALPEIEFPVPEDATTAQKAAAVFEGISNGIIPPDVGNMLIQAAKNMTDIEVNTELKERIEKIEAMLEANQ